MTPPPSVPTSDPPITVVYIHGIGNKPPAPVLKRQWDVALFSRDMGARTRMAYWADIRYPGGPLAADQGDFVDAEAATGPRTRATALRPVSSETLALELPEHRSAPAYAATMAKLVGGHVEYTPGVRTLAVHQKILPRFMRGIATKIITKAFIEDTAAYFYDPTQRDQMRDRLRSLLPADGGPYIVVAHSQGSIVAFDVLTELSSSSPVIALLVTIGSPLGIAEVKDKIEQPRAIPSIVAEWKNFADPFDPVALDKSLADEFEAGNKTITDTKVWNADTWHIRGFNPHSATGYLSTSQVRAAVSEAVGPGFTDPTARFVIAKDVAADMADPAARVPVLIELDDEAEHGNLSERRRRLVAELRKIVSEPGQETIDELKRYVAAELTGQEIAQLHANHRTLTVARIWRNARKRKLLDRSIQVVQAATAHLGYSAHGDRIHWAILDTGIGGTVDNQGRVQNEHPHFQPHRNIVARWDCTRRGEALAGQAEDKDGHGTHVAGIIAGQGQMENGTVLRGMAPEAKLHVYRVLDDKGDGNDAWIVKALDHIAALNDGAPNLVVHGINLSLGGPFDAETYACGHSPICKELRRLWRQGVVVCIAAGNEGLLDISTTGGIQSLNFDMSISDPANLEDAIAVGSVSTEAPHNYGISYFSSRGPTADGRAKPDLVAPGERIKSCNLAFRKQGESLYVEMSGTSMACPHVSGIIAAFLSVRREFIGHPDKVKQMLLAHCSDLRRDRYHQGAGMPNLLRMLADT